MKKSTLASILAYETGSNPETVKTKDAQDHLIGEAEFAGIRYLTEDLSRDLLGELIGDLEIDHAKVGNNPNSRRVLYKRALESIHKEGIEQYLSSHVDAALLKKLFDTINVTPKSDKKEALVQQLTNELRYAGLVTYFEALPLSVLHDITFGMKLEVAEGVTSSRGALVQAILFNEPVQAPEKTKKSRPSKTKKEIAKGITYQDVFQHYHVDELQEWSKENGLKVTGTKPTLIKRILAFLDGDKENTLAGTRKVARKRKSVSKPKSVSKHKSKPKPKSKSKSKPKEEAPKEEPAAPEEPPKKTEEAEEEAHEEEAHEEEAHEEEVHEEEARDFDLDLDNLESYSLKQLKEYCLEEDLEVSGKKADFIKAILEYNE